MVCSLLGSFGLHAIQIAHEHQGEHGAHGEATSHHSSSVAENVTEYLHGTEKKFFLALLAATLLIGTFVLSTTLSVCVSTDLATYVVRRRLRTPAEAPSLYTLLYSNGILNPKAH